MKRHATPELAAPKALAEPKDREFALGLYLVLAALFVSSLVTCNLAFRKFFAWTLPGLDYTFEASVGLLPYPLTFLVTDLITDDCIEWLESVDLEQPFMLACHHKAPHRTWEPAPRHAAWPT